MLNKSNLHKYQLRAVDHIINNKYCGLFLDMGLGKTISTLTAIDYLMYDSFEVDKVLVIAPKRVAEDTWMNETSYWRHVSHLTLSLVLGTKRKREEALEVDSDIYVINRENVKWLIDYCGKDFPFDMVVIDELSSFKNPSSQRFKALRKVRPQIERIVGLTGTPQPNGLMDLWSQLYLLDMGKRLGKTITSYRREYFRPGQTVGHIVYNYIPLPNSEAFIHNIIKDICISMTADDYLELPSKVVRDVRVTLSKKEIEQYNDFEKTQVLLLTEGDVTAVNAATLTNKLIQYASGAIYDEDRNVHHIHNRKVETLVELVEAANSPVLVFYNYKHEESRIIKALKEYNIRKLDTSDDIKDWNNGNIDVLIAHPASAGHGLNLQKGGNNIIWFSTPWSLELYLQANARLHRQGQTKPVVIHRLVTKGTHDERVIRAIKNKSTGQEALMDATKYLIDKHTKSNEQDRTC